MRSPSGCFGNPLTCCSNGVVTVLEEAFYRLGYGVAKYPAVAVVLSLLVAMAAASGVYRLVPELDGEKLWVPANNPTQDASRLVKPYFATNTSRMGTLIVTTDDANVLTPKAFKAMADIHEKIIAINQNNTDRNFEALCLRLSGDCVMHGLLELWQFDLTLIRGLTQQAIIQMVNSAQANSLGTAKYMSEIKRDAAKNIKEAKATKMEYVLRSEEMNMHVEDWEAHFLDVGKEGHKNVIVFRNTFRSLADEGLGVTFKDIVFLGVGFALFVIFVTFMLGRFNRIQHKMFLSMTGIFCIVLALGVSLGLGSYAQLVYSPVHNLLPFLLLGLGVHDMFVIVNALDNLTPVQKDLVVPERVGLALRSAGVSVMVTSLTGVLAFGVAISINIPALRSLCAYCLVGHLATFLLQCTFFVAWLAVDEYRADGRRDACLFCLRIRRWAPNQCSNRVILKSFVRRLWAGLITHFLSKMVVVVLAAGLLSIGICGTIFLKPGRGQFRSMESYTQAYMAATSRYFPVNTDSILTSVYLIDVDYYANYSTLEKLVSDLQGHPYTQTGSVRSWCTAYRNWIKKSTNSAVTSKLDANKMPKTKTDFYDILVNHFLKSTEGADYTKDLVLSTAGDKVMASRCTLRQHMLTNTTAQIEAMTGIRAVVAKTGFDKENAFPYAPQYLSYEGHKALLPEFYRTVGLMLLCVLLMMPLLLANILQGIFVFLCVTMIVVDVGGLMYFLGMTINTITSTILIMAVGFSMDYVSHVARTFMATEGTRGERVRRSLVLVGPAIFCAGLSTVLASIPLFFSTSFLFKTFVKMFLCIFGIALFHGLAFLPVLLSLIGPEPYESVEHSAHEHEHENDARAPWDDTDLSDYSDRIDPRGAPRYSERSRRRESRYERRSGRRHGGGHSRSRHRWDSADGLRAYVPRATAQAYTAPGREQGRLTSRSEPVALPNYYLGAPSYVKPLDFRKPRSYVKPRVDPADVSHLRSSYRY